MPFRADVPIRSHALSALGAGAARNRETMRQVRTLRQQKKGEPIPLTP